MFQATLQGGKELDAALRNLEQKQARKVVGASLRVGAKIIQRVATELVPVLQVPRSDRTAGALKKAIKVRASKKRSRDGSVTIFAGPGRGFFKGDEFYGGPIEFGWKHGKRGQRSDAAAKRIAKQLMRQSRAFRKQGGGLAAKGTAKRAQQEAFFIREGRRQTAKLPDRPFVPGYHYMEYALDEAGGAAVQAILAEARKLVDEAVNAARNESKT
jgi:hypothetical protein